MTDYREKDDLPEHDLTEEDSPEEGLPEGRLPKRLAEEDSPEDGPNSKVPILVGLRKWIIGALVLAIIGGLYWRLRSPTHVLGVSYVSDQSVTLWSTRALADLREGDDDPRANAPGLSWTYAREQVAQLTSFEAKRAGTLAEERTSTTSLSSVRCG